MDRANGGGAPKGMLRFLTCGSVDDGKSTLIGRLLYDSQLIYEDHVAALERDSRKVGTTGDEIDFALLVDGLEAEREQGITIDVAYRFFSTAARSFIVADTPGHEQYTRNMATGASNCDAAVLLVDARKGILTQTKRHAYICSLLGIREFVLAVNKMDLVGFDRGIFDRVVADFALFSAKLPDARVVPIPISGRYGDNVTRRSGHTPWYDGVTLVEHLERLDVASDLEAAPLRFPVQWVNRPNLDFRGFSGTVASGRVRPGDRLVSALSGRSSTVTRVVTADGDLPEARAGQAVTLTLADEIDVSRGDLLCSPDARPCVADQFAAKVVWMSDEPLLPGRSYLLRAGMRWTPATITDLKHRVDVNTLEELAAKQLELNEVGVCNLSTATPVAFDPYAENETTGAFILVDRLTNRTVGAGMIDFPLRRATNIHREAHTIAREHRTAMKGHRPAVLWFTGLSGSGKSTVADIVEQDLHRMGVHTMLLDGDNLRHGLNRDLGFTDADRVENIRRVGEVAKLMTDAGLVVICSFISPFEAERLMVRELFAPGDFFEIFVDTPLELCMERDPKGLYRKAREGRLKNFTGVDSPYERPRSPELHLPTPGATPGELAEVVLNLVRRAGVVG